MYLMKTCEEGPPFFPILNHGICLPVFTDLHCHRLIAAGADQNSLARSQETYFLILALLPGLSRD